MSSIRPLLLLALTLAGSASVALASAAPLNPVYENQTLVRQGYVSIELSRSASPRVVISTSIDASPENFDSVQLVNGAFTGNLATVAQALGPETLVEVAGVGNAEGQITVSTIVEAPAAELAVRKRIIRDALRRYRKNYQPTGNLQEDEIAVSILWKDDRDPMYRVTVENWGGHGINFQGRQRNFWYEINGAFRTEVWP